MHLLLFTERCLLFSGFCVMNMMHTCDSNKFTKQKQGSYYIIGAVLSYIKPFLMFLGINLLLLLCINTYNWFMQKASQNRGFIQTFRTLWLRACVTNIDILMQSKLSKTKIMKFVCNFEHPQNFALKHQLFGYICNYVYVQSGAYPYNVYAEIIFLENFRKPQKFQCVKIIIIGSVVASYNMSI